MVLTSCFSGACGSAVLSLARTVTGSDPEITYIGTETLHTKQWLQWCEIALYDNSWKNSLQMPT